jgi:hypothetical protein
LFYGSVADPYHFDADPVFTSGRIRIRLFTLIRIWLFVRIRILMRVMRICNSNPQTFHGFTKLSLHGTSVILFGSKVSLYASTVSFHSSPGFHFDADPDPASQILRIWIAPLV